MIRATTPTHIFEIPFETSIISDLRISYAQDGSEILTKKMEDCTFDGQTITCTLSQEDTLLFNCRKRSIKVQLRILTNSGEVMASDPIIVDVGECINDEVLK